MAAKSSSDRERHYELDARAVLPDLDRSAPSGGRVEHVEISFENRYFDTAERHLQRHGVVLVRRSGDSDAGWQVSFPADDARAEVRLGPTTGSSVPKPLGDLTRGARGGRPLQAAATLRVTRSSTRILGADDRLLAEVFDDRVQATVASVTSTVQQWRELTVVAGDGGSKVATGIGRLVRRAGAVRSVPGSALAHALALPRGVDDARTGWPAGEAVLEYLAEQNVALMRGDLAHRCGVDAIHPTRVASRRVRSALHVFAGLFDPDRVGVLEAELAWYAGLLGAVRDRQVLRTHCASAVAELPEELVVGPVAVTIDERLAGEEERHRRALGRAMNGARYLALLAELASWLDEPPFTDQAAAAPKTLAAPTQQAERTVARRLKSALRTEFDEDLHRTRKAAKRARYAIEAVASVSAVKDATPRIKKLTKLQEHLGEYEDCVRAANLMRELGAAAAKSTDPSGFTYGVLFAQERARAYAQIPGL